MDQNPEFQELQQSLASAQSVLVIIPRSPDLDQMAASLGLHLSLKKTGKMTKIICPQPLTVEFSQLVGIDQVSNEMGGKNLVISFDYVQDSIEKVSYNVENNKFNLVIQPKTGFSPLDAQKVKYAYSGADSDLILIVGVQKLEELGKFYEDEQDLYREKTVVNIDNHQQNSQFGKINILQPQASSYSEMIAKILKSLNLPFDEDIGRNLLLGLKAATNNFQSVKVTAETFEAAAFCLQVGAKQIDEEKPLEKKEKKIASSPNWLAPRIYKGTSRV